MNDNRVAGFVTALLVAPLVVVCCLGPAVLGSALGALVGWVGGLGPVEVIAAAFAAGLAIYGFLRLRRARSNRRPPCGIDVRTALPVRTRAPPCPSARMLSHRFGCGPRPHHGTVFPAANFGP